MSTSGEAGKVSLRNAIEATRRLDELGTARWIEAAAEVVHKSQSQGQPLGKLVPEALVMRDGNVILELPATGGIAYTAPERLRGGAGDRRSDVWSLGVMLWEALAHVRLFEGISDEALRKAVETDTITPVNEMNANVPSELGAICTKALQRDPSSRYQSAKVMAAEISAVLDDAGYPEGTEAIAKWIAKEFPVGAAPAPVALPVAAPVAAPVALPASAAVPAPLPPTPASASKPLNHTMMGMTPFTEVRPPVLPAPKVSEVIPLVNPIIPLETKKPVHDTLQDNKPAFLDHKPGTVTQGWDIVPEPKPEPVAPRPKTDSKGSLPSWATRPGSASQPPPITPSVTPAQPIAPTVPFSPSQTLQGISNPAIKPPTIDPPIMKLPDAPPGATVSAEKPAAFNTTSIVGSSISTALPGVTVQPGFAGNRTVTMGSNAIIDAVNASVSAANPPPAVVPAAPVLVPSPPVLPVVHAPVKISEAETVNTPAVTLPPPEKSDIRAVSWDDAPKPKSATAVETANPAVAKLPPPADDDFTEKESSSTGTGSKRAVTRGDRTSKGDLLAGWGVTTSEHEALSDGDDPYEADRQKSKKRLFMVMGGALAAVLLVVVIALAASGGKKEEEPVAKSMTPIGDPTKAGNGVVEPPPEPPKVVEPPKQEGSNTEPVGSGSDAGSSALPPEPKTPEPAVTKVEPPKPDPVVVKQPDPVIVKKPDVKKPDPVIVKKPDPVAVKKPNPVIVKKPDPVAVKKPDPVAKPDAATAYKAGFQLYVKGDTNGALTSFKEALASNPGYAPTWRGIGLVYEKLGRKSQAATAFKRYLELSPSAGDAEQIRNRLERLGS